jgi:hypothetical protein
MSDNTVLPGAGDTVRDIDRGAAKTQVVAVDFGGEASEQLLSPTNPLPVTVIADPYFQVGNLLTLQQLRLQQAGPSGFVPIEIPGFLAGGY